MNSGDSARTQQGSSTGHCHPDAWLMCQSTKDVDKFGEKPQIDKTQILKRLIIYVEVTELIWKRCFQPDGTKILILTSLSFFFFPFHGGIGKLQNWMRSVMENKEHPIFLKIWVIAFKLQSSQLLTIPVSRWRNWGLEKFSDCPIARANSNLFASKFCVLWGKGSFLLVRLISKLDAFHKF